MTKPELETFLRNDVVNCISLRVSQAFDTDSLLVGTGKLAFPLVDAEGNEKFVIVTVSVPRGTRNGQGGYTEYDGYAEAEAFKAEQEEKAAKHKAAEEKKQAKIARDKAKREAKENA